MIILRNRKSKKYLVKDLIGFEIHKISPDN